jgi:hypothetical protein
MRTKTQMTMPNGNSSARGSVTTATMMIPNIYLTPFSRRRPRVVSRDGVLCQSWTVK